MHEKTQYIKAFRHPLGSLKLSPWKGELLYKKVLSIWFFKVVNENHTMVSIKLDSWGPSALQSGLGTRIVIDKLLSVLLSQIWHWSYLTKDNRPVKRTVLERKSPDPDGGSPLTKGTKEVTIITGLYVSHPKNEGAY